jgi:hypothetical protein
MYHEHDPFGWLGPTGFYHTDYRSLPAPEESKTWDSLYVWAFDSYTPETMYFSLLPDTSVLCQGRTAYPAAPPPTDRRYLLELLSVPEGVVGAPAVGFVWELPVDTLFTVALPTYRTSDGLQGYRFAFTITRVVTLPGDFDQDGDVDHDDFDAFEVCFGNPGVHARIECEPGDFDGDADIDCDDWAAFQLAWTEPDDPPPLAQCEVPVPAVSEWGMVTMTLLMLAAGTVILRRRTQIA